MPSFEQFCAQIEYTAEQKSSLNLLSQSSTPTTTIAVKQDSTKTDTIDNAQAFLVYYSQIEDKMMRGQEDEYRAHLDWLQCYTTQTSNILAGIVKIGEMLDTLKDNYEFVILKTSGLQNDCQDMLNTQKNLNLTAESITSKLEFFSHIDPISTFLLGADDVVLTDEFSDSLLKLDSALEFCLCHKEYKDSSVYTMRYRQCLTRCMTLIKMYVVDVLRKTTAELKDKVDSLSLESIEKINDKDPGGGPSASTNESQIFSLIFAKFRGVAPQLKIIHEIESRCGHIEYNGFKPDTPNS